MKSKQILVFILFAYVISAGFMNMWRLPVAGAKIQPPEIIFLLAFGVWLIHFRHSLRELLEIGRLAFALLVYLTAVLISSLAANRLISYLELLGLLYLILVYMFFRSAHRLDIDLSSFLHNSFVTCGILAAVAGILGWVLTRLGVDTRLAWPAKTYYPYFGNIGRAQGFTTAPNMLLSLLAVCILLHVSDLLHREKVNGRGLLILAILTAGALLTFAKTVLLLIIGLLFVWYSSREQDQRRFRFLMLSASVLLLLVFLLGSHVLVVRKATVDWNALRNMAYTADEPFAEFDGVFLIATNYSINKVSAIRAGMRNFPFGVGSGGHNEFVRSLRIEGLYPTYFPDYDPHSTYFGAFGEIGVIGLAALLFLFFQVGSQLKRLLGQSSHTEKAAFIGIAGCFLFASLEAITTDIMNFRHYWILLGLMGAMTLNQSSSRLTGATGIKR